MLTELSASNHKYKVTTEGQITKLISGISISLHDCCYDRRRKQHV